ncbi:hypothetical protein EVAR_22746_1 [Eumeta japonica]|uniref:Uncharacterized protein n=1 Tax=Eumeta variegata TaxID=151549 RepID=A0A4C1UU87_EUMVA|nr:hypothetical protein EVAR_22746_1 [Eumeta japonica]
MHWRGGVVIEREGMRERKERGRKRKERLAAPESKCVEVDREALRVMRLPGAPKFTKPFVNGRRPAARPNLERRRFSAVRDDSTPAPVETATRPS